MRNTLANTPNLAIKVRSITLIAANNLIYRTRSKPAMLFPHKNVKDYGYQVAACVHACLDSDTDHVPVISVLHAFTDDMEQARRRVAAILDKTHHGALKDRASLDVITIGATIC
jgi:hypothetical protein